jgi:hypothetical protein
MPRQCTKSNFAFAADNPAQHMTVLFGEGECTLPTAEVTALQQWIETWCHSSSNYHVLFGGALETSRTGRLRRLAYLTGELELLGVPKRRIHPDEDWLRPSRMGALDHLPRDAVWLQIRSPSDLQAHLVLNHFPNLQPTC